MPTPGSRMRYRSIVSEADTYTYLGVNMYRLVATMGIGDITVPVRQQSAVTAVNVLDPI